MARLPQAAVQRASFQWRLHERLLSRQQTKARIFTLYLAHYSSGHGLSIISMRSNNVEKQYALCGYNASGFKCLPSHKHTVFIAKCIIKSKVLIFQYSIAITVLLNHSNNPHNRQTVDWCWVTGCGKCS